MSFLTIVVIAGAAVALLKACSRNAIVRREREQAKFRRWQEIAEAKQADSEATEPDDQ